MVDFIASVGTPAYPDTTVSPSTSIVTSTAVHDRLFLPVLLVVFIAFIMLLLMILSSPNRPLSTTRWPDLS